MAHRGERRDLIGAVPDAVIQHVLGFLPAREAVRTCVLARRWRYLWRPIPRLRIADVEAFGSVEEQNEFVDRLLLLRDRVSALVEFEFDLRGFLQLDDARVDLWIRHALMCHVRVLQVHLYTDRRVELADQPLVSRHLTRLELDGVLLEESFLDFSSCPVLEDLKVTNCVISADKILSQSLKHLSIMGCELCWRLLPTHVSAPSLVSLQLDDYVGVTPILESMLLLQTASVKLGHNNEDYCDFCDEGSSGDCTCSMCLIYWDNDCRNDVSVLLGGLSSATYLELIASSGMVTLKRDLRYCPTFSKLKSLLLNDWCLVSDLSALLCFLQHTLILEKLTLQLSKRPKRAMEMEGSNLMEQSLTLKRLKIVEVKCQMIDERVHNFLNLLSSCSICLEQINVQTI